MSRMQATERKVVLLQDRFVTILKRNAMSILSNPLLIGTQQVSWKFMTTRGVSCDKLALRHACWSALAGPSGDSTENACIGPKVTAIAKERNDSNLRELNAGKI